MREAQEEADVAAAITEVIEFERQEEQRARERRAAAITARFANFRRELVDIERFQRDHLLQRHATDKHQPCSSKDDPAENHRRELVFFYKVQELRRKILNAEQREVIRGTQPEEGYRATPFHRGIRRSNTDLFPLQPFPLSQDTEKGLSL